MAKKDEEGAIIPAGAPIPPEKETEVVTETPKTVKVGDKEYESPEALAAAYQSLESKLGAQGTELGDLRATNKVLAEQMEGLKTDAKERVKAGETPLEGNFETQLADIYKQVNEGDISVEEAMQKSNALTAEMATERAVAKANEMFQTTLQERDATAIQDGFLKANPDFVVLRDSGKLKPIKDESPMHDDFSAYFAFKEREAFEKGKAEAAKLAAGDEGTKTVLTKPGESIQQENKPKTPLSEMEAQDSMLKAMKEGPPG